MLACLGIITLALLCLFGSLRQARRRRRLADLPTSKVEGVFVGLVELCGTAESEAPLASYLAGRLCVQYRWSVEESWSRLVTETVTNSKGEKETRTRQESGWTTVAEGGESSDFYLKDETGIIRVRPARARLEENHWFSTTCRPSDRLYYDKGPVAAISDSDGVRRFSERGLPLHAPLFVVGPAREREDIVAAEIAASDSREEFIISTGSRASVLRGMGFSSWGFLLLGLLVAGVTWYFLPADWLVGVPPELMVAAPFAYLLAWPLGWTWTVYNSLVELRERTRQGWSQVDVQLKRRHDLIPSLVQVCERLAAHEHDVQEAVACLRAQLQATPPGQPGPDPAGCAAAFRAIAERYPRLVADDTFLQLQKQLIETEQRIALARSYYNDIATFYTTRQQRFPELLVAKLGAFRPAALLSAESFERAPVVVKLANSAPAQPAATA